MKFSEIYHQKQPAFSFELFPPKTDEGLASLRQRLPRLADLGPDFMTVTYGAMGSTRERTLEIASQILQQVGVETAHHLTCVGCTGEEIDELLGQIREAGIENIVALRGDPPRGETEFKPPPGGYSYAIELVRHIHRFGGFGIAVAGYPETHLEAPSPEADLQFLKEKVSAGADVVITQLFYDNRFFFDFVDRCRQIGIQVPIVPGILPIMNLSQIRRITSMCGASLPEKLVTELEAVDDDPDAMLEVGVRHAVAQSLELLDSGVPGIHFYVLNRFRHMESIMQALDGA